MTATMFERYGGFVTLRKVVSSFYDLVLDSPVISHHFAGVDMRRLIQHQTQFIAFLLDGPGTDYSDEALRRVHAPLGITPEEFDEMVALLTDTFEDYEFETADITVVRQRLRAREHVIVGALSPR
jgi:hemoglobin